MDMDLPLERLKLLARAGYASRGVVYLIIGAFAVLAAFGPGGDKKSSEGALLTLLAQPFGKTLVGLMIGGLAGYTLWRVVQSVFDTDDHGFSAKGLAVRAGLLCSGATYALLAFYALSLLDIVKGGGEGPDEPSLADVIARYVGLKPVLLALCLIFAGVAVAHWNKAIRRRYADHFDASERVMRFVHPVSIIGLAARGAVLAVISLLLFLRFLKAAPTEGEPPGVPEALTYIQGLTTGPWLLAAAGLGLMLFAAYSFSEALWRRINVEDAESPESQ